jgi:hypothetical protein
MRVDQCEGSCGIRESAAPGTQLSLPPLLFTSRHLSSLHFTYLHFTSLHFTSLHFTCPHFTSLHVTCLVFRLANLLCWPFLCPLLWLPLPHPLLHSPTHLVLTRHYLLRVLGLVKGAVVIFVK